MQLPRWMTLRFKTTSGPGVTPEPAEERQPAETIEVETNFLDDIPFTVLVTAIDLRGRSATDRWGYVHLAVDLDEDILPLLPATVGEEFRVMKMAGGPRRADLGFTVKGRLVELRPLPGKKPLLKAGPVEFVKIRMEKVESVGRSRSLITLSFQFRLDFAEASRVHTSLLHQLTLTTAPLQEKLPL